MGKDGLITARDLLRWAERHASTKNQLAEDGYMLLAERLRTPEEKNIVREEIEKQLKLTIDVNELYFGPQSAARLTLSDFNQENSASTEEAKMLLEIAPTKSILRLLNLILRCFHQREPVLLVGGKCLRFSCFGDYFGLFSLDCSPISCTRCGRYW